VEVPSKGSKANHEDRQVPIGTALPDLKIHSLPPDWTPAQAFLLIKCKDESGDDTWVYRTSHQFNLEELLGALTIHIELLKKDILEEWRSE
jgi:hypothetical protein